MAVDRNGGRGGLACAHSEQVVQCFAAALQIKLQLGVASAEAVAARPMCGEMQDQGWSDECAIFRMPAQKAGKRPKSALSAMTESSTCASTGTPPSSKRWKAGDLGDERADVPSNFEVQVFLLELLRTYRLEAEVAIIALIYIDRFVERSGEPLSSENWQRVTLIALISASKVWDEDPFDNAEFAEMSPSYDVRDINAFEHAFLQCVGYDVVINGPMYTKTHFFMQTLMSKDAGNFSMPELDEDRAAELEESSLKRQTELLDYIECLEPDSPASSENARGLRH
mmetsp:Transcript_151597/g.484581  ORF Transcript_151597/g.484581 Transcript_151597/m.484581 type:complete len:283 (+) Transcript_151597:616-1464(+)